MFQQIGCGGDVNSVDGCQCETCIEWIDAVEVAEESSEERCDDGSRAPAEVEEGLDLVDGILHKVLDAVEHAGKLVLDALQFLSDLAQHFAQLAAGEAVDSFEASLPYRLVSLDCSRDYSFNSAAVFLNFVFDILPGFRCF